MLFVNDTSNFGLGYRKILLILDKIEIFLVTLFSSIRYWRLSWT